MMTSHRANARRPWTPEDDAILRRLADAGEAPRRIADRLGRTLVAVSHRAERLKVSLGRGGPAQVPARRDTARHGDEDEPAPD